MKIIHYFPRSEKESFKIDLLNGSIPYRNGRTGTQLREEFEEQIKGNPSAEIIYI